MLLEIILALFAGIIAGSISGILPGIHINLVAVFLISVSAFFLKFTEPITLAVFIVSMSITHTFVDFLPSIFLGAPDEDTSLSVLPGHQLLLKGEGYLALIYTLFGGILALPIIIILIPIFIFLLPQAYYYLKFVMFFILIIASLYLILKEKNSKFFAFLIFMLAGFLGIASFNLNLNESLLPLLSGLFGASSLITSIAKKQEIPRQKIFKLKENLPSKSEIKNNLVAALFASPLCSFLPALGSSQAAVIGSDILGETKQKEFLMLLGSVNTIVMGLSFVTLFAINKARTGSAVAISKLIETLTFSNLLIILAAVLISAVLAFFVAIFLAKIFAKNITKIKYNKLSIIILAIISAVVIIFSGWLGLLVYIIATCTGLVAIASGVRRTHLMGSLMLPAILYYLL